MQLWIEIQRFLKDNIKIITIFGVIFALVLGGLGAFMTGTSNNAPEGMEALEEEAIETAVAFDFYIEDAEGNMYTNEGIIEEYFRSPNVLETLNADVGIDLKQIELEYYEKNQEVLSNFLPAELMEKSQIISVTQNNSTGLLTFVASSDDKSLNEKLANYYYGKLSSIPFVDEDNLYVFDGPYNVKDKQIDDDEEETGISIKSLIKYAVIGIILGIVVGIGLALIHALFGKKLNYAFGYAIDDSVDFMIYDEKLNNSDEIANFVNFPYSKNKVILSENGQDLNVSDIQEKISGNKFKVIPNIADDSVKNLMTESSEVIMVVLPNKTSRKWFNTQMKLMKLDNLSLKIIQVNE
ncbi:hypothetical protein CJ191_02410 [Aerococcus viridans]|uniref:Uncharacterized protein n=1 Tax=Aerococcus viridans TaxID=1377 RepID=A0A2N6UF65_9LACT|nr:hypothetical protein [Aerococcus viridans]PMC80218.1 hypothetical protein CJ191_02410 [Aerococcus viridans]